MSIDPRDLSAEQRAELGIDETGRPIGLGHPDAPAAAALARERLAALEAKSEHVDPLGIDEVRAKIAAELDAERNAEMVESDPSAPDPETGPRQDPAATIGAGDAELDALLLANGYAAIRTELWNIGAALVSARVEAFDAVRRFTERNIGKARLNPDPRAAEVVEQAEYELKVLAVLRRARIELHALEERQQARNRLAGR